MNNADLKIEAKIEEVVLIPGEHLTMEEAIEKVKELGHDIIKVEGRNITVHKEQ